MRAVVLAQMATLRITSPADGDVVHSGETFTVTVGAEGGHFTSVAMVPPAPIGGKSGNPLTIWTMPVLTEPPFVFTFSVPLTMRPGRYPFVADGNTDSKVHVVSSRVWFDIERPDQPISVQLAVEGPFHMKPGDQFVLDVFGSYKNGDRLILNASRQTTFTSEDPSIVAIHDWGDLIAMSEGTTTVDIQVGDKRFKAQVIVSNRE